MKTLLALGLVLLLFGCESIDPLEIRCYPFSGHILSCDHGSDMPSDPGRMIGNPGVPL